MQILETEGIDQLTIRGLAGKLGVAATAIYWHVGDKQALLDGLAERVIDELGEVSVRGRDPVSRIVRWPGRCGPRSSSGPTWWPWSTGRVAPRRCSNRPAGCWSGS